VRVSLRPAIIFLNGINRLVVLCDWECRGIVDKARPSINAYTLDAKYNLRRCVLTIALARYLPRHHDLSVEHPRKCFWTVETSALEAAYVLHASITFKDAFDALIRLASQSLGFIERSLSFRSEVSRTLFQW
jgi:hypothetical protein